MELTLYYTLIGDGNSDRALLNIIKWLIDDLYPQLPTQGSFADFRNIPNPPKKGNINRQIEFAEKYYPYHVLFYHRDAEELSSNILARRKEEVLKAISTKQTIVCIVPIKMMETWLLIDKTAIKRAAGNRNYKGPINLPPIKDLEKVNDPKERLYNLLKEASGMKGRRLNKFNEREAVHLVAEYTQDFSSLRNLTAFKAFEADLKTIVDLFLKKE